MKLKMDFITNSSSESYVSYRPGKNSNTLVYEVIKENFLGGAIDTEQAVEQLHRHCLTDWGEEQSEVSWWKHKRDLEIKEKCNFLGEGI